MGLVSLAVGGRGRARNTEPPATRAKERIKRPPRPRGREQKYRNALQAVYAEARGEALYEMCRVYPHLGDDTYVTLDGEMLSKPQGRPPHFPAEAYVLFEMYMGAAKCGEREAESYLRDPDTWDPIRRELQARYPAYPRLAPGQPGPTRNQYQHWKRITASRPRLLNALLTHFREQACDQAQDMGMFDPAHTSFTDPQLSDQLIGDGTVAKSMFNAIPGEMQYNPLTDELEPIRCDPDARLQHRRNTDDEILSSDVAGTHYGLIHGTTGEVNEVVVLDLFHVPGGKGNSEVKEAIGHIASLVDQLDGGVKGVMWDKAMRGKQIDQIYDLGVLCHAKVSQAPGGGPKEVLVEMATIRTSEGIVGELPLVSLGGAIHLRVDTGTESHLVPLEPGKTSRRENTGGRGRRYRFLLEACVPDDPRVPARYRGGTIRTRLDTTPDDLARKFNRAENLRPIAETHDKWKIVGGQRSRAESLNSRVKHRWANGRLPAVGVPNQLLRLLGVAMAINREAAMAYEERTGRRLGHPPPHRQAA